METKPLYQIGDRVTLSEFPGYVWKVLDFRSRGPLIKYRVKVVGDRWPEASYHSLWGRAEVRETGITGMA